jgi:tetraacyldisaccharide 4'-kinase
LKVKRKRPQQTKAPKKPLAPLGSIFSLCMRLRASRYQRGKIASWQPPAPCVSVGGVSRQENGRVLMSAWILGWAQAKKLSPVVLTPPIGAAPSQTPFLIEPGADFREAGAEAYLLAKYRPEAKILVDKNMSRAGQTASKIWQPGLFLLHDGFSHLEARRGVDIVLLGRADCDASWNRVTPSGSWREGAEALGRADVLVLHMDTEDFEASRKLIEERLAPLEKPIFSFSFKIWQVREPGVGPVTDFEEEPYILVCGDGEQHLAGRAAEKFLGHKPRFRLTFPDDHRATTFDAQKVAAEAKRMRCGRVLCAPKQAVWLAPMEGPKLYVYDPELSFGPAFGSSRSFGDWWSTAWLGMLEER